MIKKYNEFLNEDIDYFSYLKKFEGQWIKFIPYWWSYDEIENVPYPEDGVVIKLKEIKYLHDGVVFIDYDDKKYYPDTDYNILKRKGPVGGSESNGNDPYNEEDWNDEANEEINFGHIKPHIKQLYKDWKKERGRKKLYGNMYDFVKQGEKYMADIQVNIDKIRNSRDELERMLGELKDNQRKIEEKSFNDLSEEEKEKVLQQRAELEIKMGQMDPYNEEDWGDDDGFRIPSKYRDYIEKLKGIKNYLGINLDIAAREKDIFQQNINQIKNISRIKKNIW